MADRDVLSRRDRAGLVEALRKTVDRLEKRGAVLEAAGTGATDGTPAWRFGLDDVDRALPAEGLALGALHEIAGFAHGDLPAATGFALALLNRRAAAGGATAQAPILWGQTAEGRREFGPVYGHGLAAFGLDPGRFVFADARRETDLLWAMEESVRTGCLAAVVGEAGQAGFTPTRRLALAAEAGGTPVLLLRTGTELPATAARTRWRVGGAVGLPDTDEIRAPGAPRWRAELVRAAGGRPGAWMMDWNDETHSFGMAAPAAARPAETRRHAGGQPDAATALAG